MIKLWCLHGNLQQPSVWKFLEEELEFVELEFVDLWKSDASSFWDWAEEFCRQVTREPDRRHVLLGYSLGGRLGLHALLHCPELWQAAIIVAADSGLSDELNKEKRLAWDQVWGERFLQEDWEKLLAEWDAQGVFADYKNQTKRYEKNFLREDIARLFDVFSKGRQDDLLPQLKQLENPKILYLSGEDDPKYSEVGVNLGKTCPAISHTIIKQAAHRLPWENQKDFSQTLKAFLTEL